MYQVKILKIHEFAEWQPSPNNPDGGAGPAIEGAWLARRVMVKTSNVDSGGNPLTVIETRDLLIPEPYTTEKMIQTVADYKAGLPERSADEGLVL